MRAVADMFRYLMRTISQDIELTKGETLASFALTINALGHMMVELRDGCDDDAPLEPQYRVIRALEAMSPQFDDDQLRRVRALFAAEGASERTRIPTDEEVEKHVAALKKVDPQRDDDSARQWFGDTLPVLDGVLARCSLASIDERFGELDPLILIEEFGEASANGSGGRTEAGEGRIGPATALARLSLRCGALGFRQNEDEDFDAAVDRVRRTLLMSRSRVRKTIATFAIANGAASTAC